MRRRRPARTPQSELDALREQLAAIKAENEAVPETHDWNEAETRRLLIDLALQRAGWPLDQRARPGVRSHGHAQREGRRLRRLRAVGRRRQAAGGGGGQEDDGRPRGGPAAGEALRRLPGGDARPAADHLLHQRLRDPHLGRSRLPAAQRRRVLQEGRAGLPDPPPLGRAKPLDVAQVEGRRSSSATTRSAPSASIAEQFDEDAAQGAAGHGHRHGQDPHGHRAGGRAAAGGLGEAGAVPGRPHLAGEPGGATPSRRTCPNRAR